MAESCAVYAIGLASVYEATRPRYLGPPLRTQRVTFTFVDGVASSVNRPVSPRHRGSQHDGAAVLRVAFVAWLPGKPNRMHPSPFPSPYLRPAPLIARQKAGGGSAYRIVSKQTRSLRRPLESLWPAPCEELFHGTPAHTPVPVRELVQAALRHSAAAAFFRRGTGPSLLYGKVDLTPFTRQSPPTACATARNSALPLFIVSSHSVAGSES